MPVMMPRRPDETPRTQPTPIHPDRQTAPEVLVLFSGGIDSSALLALYRRLRRPVAGLHVDYGQPAARHESMAAARISKVLDMPLLGCRWNGIIRKAPGLIMGRNAFLLFAALMEAPSSTTTIAIGIHSGTPYADCSSTFVDRMQLAFDVYGSPIAIAAPFITWRKADIFAFAHEAGIPLDLTHSCESGGLTACGSCASCRDREALHVGA